MCLRHPSTSVLPSAGEVNCTVFPWINLLVWLNSQNTDWVGMNCFSCSKNNNLLQEMHLWALPGKNTKSSFTISFFSRMEMHWEQLFVQVCTWMRRVTDCCCSVQEGNMDYCSQISRTLNFYVDSCVSDLEVLTEEWSCVGAKLSDKITDGFMTRTVDHMKVLRKTGLAAGAASLVSVGSWLY